jgi:hypothetical protein
MSMIRNNGETGAARAQSPLMSARHEPTAGPATAHPTDRADPTNRPDPTDRADPTDIRALHGHSGAIADQLAEHAARLARENEALEDLPALIAHEVKSTLLHALRDDEPGPGAMRALELVDTILETIRAGQPGGNVIALDEVLRRAISDLGRVEAKILTSADGAFPLPVRRCVSWCGTCC